MTDDLLFQIALTLVPGVGSVQMKALIETIGDAKSVFDTSLKQLGAVENIGEIRARSIKTFSEFLKAEEEIKLVEKHDIIPLFITDKEYPKRLLNCYDSPVLLYYKGNADLNTPRVISIIGTRNNTDYSRQVIETLLSDIKEYSPLIISGLAFGVDSLAHKSSLQNRLSTVGVLGNGF